MSHTAPRSSATDQPTARGGRGQRQCHRAPRPHPGLAVRAQAAVDRRRRLLLRVLRHRHDLLCGAGHRDAVPRVEGDGHTVGDQQPDRLHHRRVRRQHDRRQVGPEAQPRDIRRGVLDRHRARRGEHERHRVDRVPLHLGARNRSGDRRGHHLHQRAVTGSPARALHELGDDRRLRGIRGRAVHRARARAHVRVRVADPVPDRRARRRDDPVHAARSAAVSPLARLPGTDRRGARDRRRGRGDRARGDGRRPPSRTRARARRGAGRARPGQGAAPPPDGGPRAAVRRDLVRLLHRQLRLADAGADAVHRQGLQPRRQHHLPGRVRDRLPGRRVRHHPLQRPLSSASTRPRCSRWRGRSRCS